MKADENVPKCNHAEPSGHGHWILRLFSAARRTQIAAFAPEKLPTAAGEIRTLETKGLSQTARG